MTPGVVRNPYRTTIAKTTTTNTTSRRRGGIDGADDDDDDDEYATTGNIISKNGNGNHVPLPPPPPRVAPKHSNNNNDSSAADDDENDAVTNSDPFDPVVSTVTTTVLTTATATITTTSAPNNNNHYNLNNNNNNNSNDHSNTPTTNITTNTTSTSTSKNSTGSDVHYGFRLPSQQQQVVTSAEICTIPELYHQVRGNSNSSGDGSSGSDHCRRPPSNQNNKSVRVTGVIWYHHVHDQECNSSTLQQQQPQHASDRCTISLIIGNPLVTSPDHNRTPSVTTILSLHHCSEPSKVIPSITTATTAAMNRSVSHQRRVSFAPAVTRPRHTESAKPRTNTATTTTAPHFTTTMNDQNATPHSETASSLKRRLMGPGRSLGHKKTLVYQPRTSTGTSCNNNNNNNSSITPLSSTFPCRSSVTPAVAVTNPDPLTTNRSSSPSNRRLSFAKALVVSTTTTTTDSPDENVDENDDERYEVLLRQQQHGVSTRTAPPPRSLSSYDRWRTTMSPDYVLVQIRPRTIANIIGSIQVHDLVTVFGELVVVDLGDDDDDDHMDIVDVGEGATKDAALQQQPYDKSYRIHARIIRNVNGTNMKCYTDALMTRRRFLLSSSAASVP